VLRSQKGVALLMALVALSLLYFLAMEVSYDTTVDFVVARQQVSRIKAYYAAKSGIELSLLRVMLYKQAVATMGSSLGPNMSMLDPIWSFPLMWPPTLALEGSKATGVDQDMMKSTVAESLMEAQYTTTISPEGGRIDINDLGSDVKGLKQLMINQVLRIFASEVEHNEDFQKKYSGYNFQQLVNNIADYIDEDSEGLNGGDETSAYRDLPDNDIKMPPNRALRTLDELHQVAGMTDDFYNVLASRVTVFGTKGINVNYAPKEVLMALDPSMTEMAVDKAITRRSDPKQGGFFKDDNDFYGFLQGYGDNTRAMQEAKIPLLYDMEFNFRIVSTGLSANVRREITAVTYDYPNLAQRLVDILNKQDQSTTPAPAPDAAGKTGDATKTSGSATGATGSNQKIKAATGRPTVVYWEEN
jgi:general secretion pathway protein K